MFAKVSMSAHARTHTTSPGQQQEVLLAAPQCSSPWRGTGAFQPLPGFAQFANRHCAPHSRHCPPHPLSRGLCRRARSLPWKSPRRRGCRPKRTNGGRCSGTTLSRPCLRTTRAFASLPCCSAAPHPRALGAGAVKKISPAPPLARSTCACYNARPGHTSRYDFLIDIVPRDTKSHAAKDVPSSLPMMDPAQVAPQSPRAHTTLHTPFSSRAKCRRLGHSGF